MTAQGILSLQQACAAQVASRHTMGLAIGTVVGSTALSYVSSPRLCGCTKPY